MRFVAGEIVSGVVTGHHSWGVSLELEREGAEAAVDLRFVGELPPKPDWPVFPPIGSRVTGVVQLYTPSGQLRVSLRPSDVEKAKPRP
jgi:hypothetical protein